MVSTIQTEQPMRSSSVLSELTEQAIARMGNASSARLREVMTHLIQHLHDFLREANVTQEEWRGGIDFLTRTGQMCSATRQEFILLSDILGASMLVDAVNNRGGRGLTESTVLGPFYAGPQREIEQGATILSRLENAEPLVMTGTVADADGCPIQNALVEVWQTAPNQLYDVQDPDQPQGHLRASQRTDVLGRYRFQTVVPVSYPIPFDGPAGELLKQMGRHPFRPAHVHFMISAPRRRTLVTHLFIAGDEYLDSDAVFGVKPSLIVTPIRNHGVLTVKFDFGLASDPQILG